MEEHSTVIEEPWQRSQSHAAIHQNKAATGLHFGFTAGSLSPFSTLWVLTEIQPFYQRRCYQQVTTSSEYTKDKIKTKFLHNARVQV